MKVIETPKSITFQDLVNRNSLSPSNYQHLNLKNKNIKVLKDLVETPVEGGKEVGSKEYIPKSNKFFIRTSAFQSQSLLLDKKPGSVLPIRPQVFTDHSLKEGDVLILKDSNVGEVV